MSRIFVAGFGCRRGCSEAALRQLMETALHDAGLSIDEIAAFASIDKKCDEAGLLALSQTLAKPLRFFTSRQLGLYDHCISQVSDMASRHLGSASVAEAAALAGAEALHAGPHARLFINKCSTGEATFAVAVVARDE